MNADEWIAARAGTEGTLALAMAQVIVSQRLAKVPADASRLAGLLARHTPRAVAEVTGVEQAAIVRLATEFANSKGGLAIAGGMAAQYPNGAEIVAAVNVLNYVAGAVVQDRSEEHTSELQSQSNLVCRLLLEKKKQSNTNTNSVLQ